MKSPIELYLADRINSQNEIPFSEFMEISLYHKDYGYFILTKFFNHKTPQDNCDYKDIKTSSPSFLPRV